MAPGLRFPISAPMEQFERSMQEARRGAGETTRTVVRQFAEMNKGVLTETATMAAGFAGRYTAMGASITNLAGTAMRLYTSYKILHLAGAAAFGVVGASIEAAKNQLQEMLDIAEKAGKTGLSAEGFQSFLGVTRELKVEAADLETALGNLFHATKGKLDEMNGLQSRLEEFYLAGFFSKSDNARGLPLYRSAETLDQKLRAVLVSMVELEGIGQRLASLDIAERAFGSKFADNIRLGKTSAAEMLTTFDKMRSGGDIFSNETVTRAAEMRRELDKAYATISRNLQPSAQELNSAFLSIEGIWLRIVQTIADATTKMAEFRRETPAQFEARHDAATGAASPSDPTSPSFVNPRMQRQRKKILETHGRGEEYGPLVEYGPPIPENLGATEPAMPWDKILGHVSSGAPRQKDRDADARAQLDLIERYVSSLNQANAEMEAQLATFGKSNVEQETAVALARAKALAQREGRELSEQELKDITAGAVKHAELTAQLERQRDVQQEIASLGRDFSDAVQQALIHGKSLNEVATSLMQRLSGRAIEKSFDSIFDQLGKSAGAASGGAGIFSAIGSLLGLAGGGPVRGPGTSTSDSVPALLSDGEFVIRADVAQQYGPLLRAMNEGHLRHFAQGGLVGPRVVPAVVQRPRADRAGQPVSPVAVHVNVANYAGATVETKSRRNSDGSIDLDMIIDQAQARNISRPGSATDTALMTRNRLVRR